MLAPISRGLPVVYQISVDDNQLTAFLLSSSTLLIEICNVELRAYLAVTCELVGAGALLGGRRKTMYLSRTKILGRAKISRNSCLETRFFWLRGPWTVESIVEELYFSSRRSSRSLLTLYLFTETDYSIKTRNS